MDRTRSEPMIRDLLFGTTAAALAAFGYTVLGPMDVEAWQAILLLGLGGYALGYIAGTSTRYAYYRGKRGTHLLTLDRKTGHVTNAPTNAYRRRLRREGRDVLADRRW